MKALHSPRTRVQVTYLLPYEKKQLHANKNVKKILTKKIYPPTKCGTLFDRL